MKKVLILGGSGLVGKELQTYFNNQGISTQVLTRNPKLVGEFLFNYQDKKVNLKAFDGVDTIINLAGANVAGKKWTEAYKQEIYDSRVLTTRFLREVLASNPNQIKTIVSASATGIYENNQEKTWKEDDTLGDDFLARVCKDWETETMLFQTLGIRVVALRMGVVMSAKGGFLPAVIGPMKFWAGTTFGSGKQNTPWIHINDLVKLYHFVANRSEISGIYNAVTANVINNKDLTKLIAAKLKKPLILPAVPAWVLNILFGGFSAELLADKKVSNQKIIDARFKFEFEDFKQMLEIEL
ncbi:MAG: TIGR01777 family protein [Bacteroidetes bacterium]|nr:TIGR01777 family protein [Bacteroidota bacterium]